MTEQKAESGNGKGRRKAGVFMALRLDVAMTTEEGKDVYVCEAEASTLTGVNGGGPCAGAYRFVRVHDSGEYVGGVTRVR